MERLTGNPDQCKECDFFLSFLRVWNNEEIGESEGPSNAQVWSYGGLNEVQTGEVGSTVELGIWMGFQS